MKINEIILLSEKIVDSSWLSDIRYDRKPRSQADKKSKTPKFSDVIITLRDGHKYTVHDVPYKVYRMWVTAPSRGVFWHKNIKNQYNVT